MNKSLPPLILHPFADSKGPGKLVESSRASLMLQGLLPSGERNRRDLQLALLEGRYQEIRMLFYVGKDLVRWIDQCMEHVNRDAELRGQNIQSQSFAQHLIDHPPAAVQAKLKKWGVADFRAIFSRALGLNAIWSDLPARESLADNFVRHYYRFADQMFLCEQNQVKWQDISGMGFDFEIYASGEYSRMLEQQWASVPSGSDQ